MEDGPDIRKCCGDADLWSDQFDQVVAETDDVTSPAEVPPVTTSSAEVVQWPCSDLQCCCCCFKIT